MGIGFVIVMCAVFASLVCTIAASAHPADSERARTVNSPLTASDRVVAYQDPVGDNEGDLAPDITDITVSLVGGRFMFRIGIGNLGSSLITEEFVIVFIDTDRNPATGCDGHEMTMSVLGAIGADFARLGRCEGSSMNLRTPQGSFRFVNFSGPGIEGPGAIAFSLNADELGTNSFRFIVGSQYEGILTDYFDVTPSFSFRASSSSTPSKPSTNRPSGRSGITIARHVNLRAEATGPSGARVRYAPARVRGAKGVTYSRSSGSVFPLGRTTVRVTARNGNRVARSSFVVLVVDTTPPTLSSISSVATSATEPTSAALTYGAVTALDRVDTSPSVTCSPTSATVLAPGVTTLSCTARDRFGNSASASLRVSVPIYTTAMSVQTNTAHTYDTARRLTGATTAITMAIPPAPDGTPVAYTWSVSGGTITGNGPTASWVRQVDAATPQLVGGTVTATVTFTSGRTETRTIQFP